MSDLRDALTWLRTNGHHPDVDKVLVDAAERWLTVEESKPMDDEFDELTMVLAWIDADAINRRHGEWVGVCGDARLVASE